MMPFSDIVIDSTSGEVWRGDKSVRLTATEFEIFSVLWHRKGKPISAQELYRFLNQLRPDCDWPDKSTVRVFIAKMRPKLVNLGVILPAQSDGSGYRIETTSAQAAQRRAA